MIKKISLYIALLPGIMHHAQALEYGMATLQGKRATQEDRTFVQKIDTQYTLVALFDGHGGSTCVDYVLQNLPLTIASKIKNDITEKDTDLLLTEKTLALLCASFKTVNDNFLEKVTKGGDLGFESGTTASVALLHNNTLYTAYVGDSRIVRSNGKALTDDHTLKNEQEKKRIDTFNKDNNDLLIAMDRMKRLTTNSSMMGDSLAITRAFGDFKFTKVGLIAEPIVCYTSVKPNEFIIVASDGIWDVLSNQEAVAFVKNRIEKKISLTRAAQELCLYAASHDPRKTHTLTEKMAFKKELELCDDPTIQSKCDASKTGHDNQSAVIVVF